MPLAFILPGFTMLVTNIVATVIGTAPQPFPPALGDSHLPQLLAFMASPSMRYVSVLLILIGGLTHMLKFGPSFGFAITGQSPTAVDESVPLRPDLRPSLTPAARASADRVDQALGRLRSMPAENFSQTARHEYDAIRDKHLPGLRAAHATARAAFPAPSADAVAIDTDFARSLDLVSGKLEEIIVGCGDEARSGFEVERRFVELRHPSSSDLLALPEDSQTERGE